MILESNKTTVSVTTGHSEYWLLYDSIGNIHNNVGWAHGAGIVLIGFLAILKGLSFLFQNVLHTLHALLEFCYIVWKNSLTQTDLDQLKNVLSRLHQYWSVFPASMDGVLHPRQHALLHYHSLIQLFGAPNGLCSLITESKPSGQLRNLGITQIKINPLDKFW